MRYATKSELLSEAFLHAFTGYNRFCRTMICKKRTQRCDSKLIKEIMHYLEINSNRWRF
ncbi:MAG: hypothetical protein ACFC1C_03600 [Candidatus Malihini olakiniferum]